eukprot:NODE_222_length_1783_cov_287.879630.p1 GENE.NODE_222_length_1783_cov_287.879630~~NODE_222_length_1783_cov_287.879630.p1  ORF type:complete len:269 (+),score=57.04 NODE_222_length_1783_cov_287.879630:3-809(+)
MGRAESQRSEDRLEAQCASEAEVATGLRVQLSEMFAWQEQMQRTSAQLSQRLQREEEGVVNAQTKALAREAELRLMLEEERRQRSAAMMYGGAWPERGAVELPPAMLGGCPAPETAATLGSLADELGPDARPTLSGACIGRGLSAECGRSSSSRAGLCGPQPDAGRAAATEEIRSLRRELECCHKAEAAMLSELSAAAGGGAAAVAAAGAAVAAVPRQSAALVEGPPLPVLPPADLAPPECPPAAMRELTLSERLFATMLCVRTQRAG